MGNLLTRDAIQGFIDGYLVSKADPNLLQNSISEWLSKHQVYPYSDQEIKTILSDLSSYRGAHS